MKDKTKQLERLELNKAKQFEEFLLGDDSIYANLKRGALTCDCQDVITVFIIKSDIFRRDVGKLDTDGAIVLCFHTFTILTWK